MQHFRVVEQAQNKNPWLKLLRALPLFQTLIWIIYEQVFADTNTESQSDTQFKSMEHLKT